MKKEKSNLVFPEWFKKIEAELSPAHGQQFILLQLNRFEWAITAVQAQDTPQDMERMVRGIIRDALLSFIYGPDILNSIKESKINRDEIAVLYNQFILSINMINWKLFFDRVKGKTRFYTMPEVCEILDLTRQTIVKYVKQGDLQAVKAGSRWRFPIETIENYLESLWAKQTPEDKFPKIYRGMTI